MLQLRPEQRRIADYRGGWLAVPAVPGAGKTTTLAALAAELIKEGRQKPGKILIVTCMNSAVANFKARIGRLLKQAGLAPRGYEVKTLHALAVKILRRYPEIAMVNQEFLIIDEHRQNEVIRSLAADWIAAHREEFYTVLENGPKESYEKQQSKRIRWENKFIRDLVGQLIKNFKCVPLSIAQLQEICAGEPLLSWGLAIYQDYQRYLCQNGMLDFDDLIGKALWLLENNAAVLTHFQQEWPYIFEDEAQDSNILQERMLYLLSQGNLVRVGDLNQSIMGTFTLSDAKLFRHYCENAKTKVLPIYCSSRSAEPIISFANQLVAWTRQYHPEQNCRQALEDQVISLAPPDDPFPNPPAALSHIVQKEFANKEAEMERIVTYAVKSLEKDPGSTVAILMPMNTQIDDYAAKLTALSVPFQEITKYPRERRRVILLLGELLAYLAKPHDPKLFFQVLVLLDYLPQEMEMDLLPWLQELDLEKLLYPLGAELERPVFLTEAIWENLKQGKEKLKSFLSLSGIEPEALILYLGEIISLSPEDMAIVQRIALEVRSLKRLQPNWRLNDLAIELKSANNSFNFFANLVYERQGYEPKPGEITLLTYHKAKGLEWDTVYLTNIDNWIFPSRLVEAAQGDLYYLQEAYRNPLALAKAKFAALLGQPCAANPLQQAKEEVIGEKVRLLYVGITRAKKNLFLSGKIDKINQVSSAYLCWAKRYLQERQNEKSV